MEHLTDGILLIDKCEGETSYGVVKEIKRLLKIRKVGHAGTLDPFATGLLVILLGQGTKLSQFIMSEKKGYLATMRLGIETDTLDLTGRVVGTGIVPEIKSEFVRERALSFVGDIEQRPPIYSAVRYKGTRAYKLARKGLEINLKKRMVTVYSIRILSVCLPDITMEVRCSKGTYLRSLSHDLAKKLGTCGHLRSLRRFVCGSLDVKDALSSRNILIKDSCHHIRSRIIPLSRALPGIPEIEVDEALAEKVGNGYQPTWEELADPLVPDCKDGYVKLIRVGRLVAVMEVKKNKETVNRRVKIERVFP